MHYGILHCNRRCLESQLLVSISCNVSAPLATRIINWTFVHSSGIMRTAMFLNTWLAIQKYS